MHDLRLHQTRQALFGVLGDNGAHQTLCIEVSMEATEAASVLLVHSDMVDLREEYILKPKNRRLFWNKGPYF